MINRIFPFLLMATIAWACGSKTEKVNTEDYGEPQAQTEQAPAQAPAEASEEDMVKEGAALVAKNDCTTCHHQTDKLIGPAHKEVAEKYAFTPENVKMLAEKIIKGGTGNWGQIPMTPHPNISQADAEKMAMYVLSLDGEKESK
ncbi:MAG: c-type cytochrome [Cyclobacteriaceae bacterium]|nr:c-type cytochrome [Cyclobacteriaceae bacterium]MCB0500643.1 c-type cytochrome [Cyclobacteriaceae bacterium]MCB9236309.1 c-type cytochrome [Flammeovirgaceae bacterium]MCO5272756.1 c-type cytochrome [Cyclobacteriaceae bacterium]MCW5902195.1 c-type cytochrome [Cyclobacteriaceae bacterium]